MATAETDTVAATVTAVCFIRDDGGGGSGGGDGGGGDGCYTVLSAVAARCGSGLMMDDDGMMAIWSGGCC